MEKKVHAQAKTFPAAKHSSKHCVHILSENNNKFHHYPHVNGSSSCQLVRRFALTLSPFVGPKTSPTSGRVPLR